MSTIIWRMQKEKAAAAAAAKAAEEAAAAEEKATKEWWAQFFREYGELLTPGPIGPQGFSGEPGQPGQPGQPGPAGPAGKDAVYLVSSSIVYGPDGFIAGVIDSMSDGAQRTRLVRRDSAGRPVSLDIVS